MNPIMTEPAASVPTVDPAPETTSGGRAGDVFTTSPRGGGGRGGLGRALLMVALGFAGGVGGAASYDSWHDDGASTSNAPSNGAVFQPTNDETNGSDSDEQAVENGDALTPREVYTKVSPAVVHIDARVVKTETGFFGLEQEQETEGTGSGFLIDDDGHIVTNAHVVADAKELTVALGTGNKVRVPAKLIGTDPSADIAVIQIDTKAKELDGVELAAVSYGDSSKLQVGDPVVAIGNPFGLDRTLTTGVVSALQREIPSLTDFQISDVIQTDAAVNPGNSGGPLLDSQGRVIGVNSQIQTRSGGFDGIAFAVPSSRVEAVAKDLIKDGEVHYAWLGVAGGEITPELVKDQDLPVDQGVLLGEVSDGSPADEAGLKGGSEAQGGDDDAPAEGGDIILSFDGTKLTTMRELADIVDSKDPGDKVKVEYLRDGKRRMTTVTLGERPSKITNNE
ncbi:MAG: hypothetical protein JWL76_712 [Thermoleophilia bacterium]|nr:hypothetical protein [Thermoleophilia bacterium]